MQITEKEQEPGKLAKLRHVQACLSPESQYQKSSGFDLFELEHQAASALSFDKITIQTKFLNHNLKAPLMIAPMTGGMQLGALLNERWARAAEYFGLAFGVGSQRLALEDPRVRTSFQVRAYAPQTFIFANLGVAQLVNGMNAEHALKAVDMIRANALFVHLNPLQEACQSHGNRNFAGILSALSKVVEYLYKYNIPVLAREVGFGLSESSARALINCGIAGLDCAGAGGTSWAKVEALCASEEKYRRLGQVFGEWGIPTAQSIRNVRQVNKSIPLIATGGIRSGLDVAKALKLGCNLVAMAQPMLAAAMKGEDELFEFIERILEELKVAMFASGIACIQEFNKNS
jgi:isopentenyl-diphosphate delta-isomerase